MSPFAAVQIIVGVAHQHHHDKHFFRKFDPEFAPRIPTL